MEIYLNRDIKAEWLKGLISAYNQKQKEAEEKVRDESEIRELRRREREDKFKEIYLENIYPAILSYHLKLDSVYKQLNLGPENTEFESDPNEADINELEINESYIRFSLNEEEYLPPIELEVCIKGDFPKVEWLQFKQVTKAYVEEKIEDFIVNAFQVVA